MLHRLIGRSAGLLQKTSSLINNNAFLFSRRKGRSTLHNLQRKYGVTTSNRITNKMKYVQQMRSNIQAVDEQEKQQQEKQKETQNRKDKQANALKDSIGKFSQPKTSMYLLIALATGALVFYMKYHPEQVDPFGVQISQVQFYNKINQKEFNNVKVIRRLHKNSDNTKPQWATNLVATSNGKNYFITVHNLKDTLHKLDQLPVHIQFQHQITKQNTQKQSNMPFVIHLAMIGMLIYFMSKLRKTGLNDIANIRGKPYKPAYLRVKIQFKDVAGLQQAKQQITEFVEFLKKPEKFTEMGAKIPRGALLTGPPGTGKTLLAKACAGEAGVPFFYISGSEFVEKFVGVGASRVRSLFQSATKKAPSIIFIDQIDAIGKKRGTGPRTNEERISTLNQLLVNMDGFGTNSKVVVLAATNRKDMLDPALLRPGRFDRIVEITLPDLEGRKQILNVHLDKVRISPQLTKESVAKRLASLTPGFSGADLSNICNEAAIMAARENKDYVEMIDFEKATERVLAGLEKRNNLTDDEKKIIAYHQSGRAVASWLLEGGDPLIKLTIIPRSKKSMGYSQFLPDQVSLYSKQELLDKISCALAGKVAEELVLKQITDSSMADLDKAKKIANAMVTRYGMSEVISNIGYPDSEIIKKPYSSILAEKIDDEVHRIITTQTQRVKVLLTANMDKLTKLAEAVLQKEALNLNEIESILGQRPFTAKSNYKAYLDLSKDKPIEPSDTTN